MSPDTDTATQDALRAAVDQFEERLPDLRWLASLDAATLQRLLAAAVKAYAGKVELGERLSPFPGDTSASLIPTPTEVCVTASAMLEVLQVEVFELAMWRTWGSVATASEVQHGE